MTVKTHKKQIPFSDPFRNIRENVYFVLVEPAGPANVGSVARAMKTSGFKKLILVNPCDVSSLETRKMAHRSYDIIEQAKTFQSFNEAIASFGLVIATTMRSRHFKFPFLTPEETSDKLGQIAVNQPVAIVFGSEKNGLSNEQLLQSHTHTTMTTATQKPALNLV